MVESGSESYIPERADIIWLDFSPQLGNEQAGHRPALVISPKSYNQRIGLGIFCPITSIIKGYPFEVKLSPENKIQGVILTDHIKSLDWQARNAKKVDAVSEQIMQEVLIKLAPLLGFAFRPL